MNDEHLKDVNQAGVRSETPASRDACPPPETMLRLLRSRLTGRKAARVIDHVSQCGYCTGEFKFLLETIRHEEPLVRAAEDSAGALQPSRAGEHDARDSRGFFARRTLNIRRLSWKPIALVAGLAVIGLALSRLNVIRAPGQFRSGGEPGVKLIRPVGREATGLPLTFKWKSVEGAESYSFELFDRMLIPLWKKDGIGRSEVFLPEEAVNRLAGGAEFFWMVTAYLPDGEQRTSRLEKFTLKE